MLLNAEEEVVDLIAVGRVGAAPVVVAVDSGLDRFLVSDEFEYVSLSLVGLQLGQ